jgi:hypothetical protein
MSARRNALKVILCGLVASTMACSGASKTRTTRATDGYDTASSINAESDGDYGAPAPGYDPGPLQPQHRERFEQKTERPGLGTEFGERVYSQVRERAFDRATSSPFASVALFYNDAEGVRAQVRHRGGDLDDIRAYTPGGGISIALTDSSGNVLPGGDANGRTYVVGQDGARYNLVIRNDSGGRFEVIASVDGLDVIDGKAAGHAKRGYILEPYSLLTIDGFRTSEETVAAFRFGKVKDSYASRTGSDRNVGVIGVAFFAERGSVWTTDEINRRETADPFPNKYSAPPPLRRGY